MSCSGAGPSEQHRDTGGHEDLLFYVVVPYCSKLVHVESERSVGVPARREAVAREVRGTVSLGFVRVIVRVSADAC